MRCVIVCRPDINQSRSDARSFQSTPKAVVAQGQTRNFFPSLSPAISLSPSSLSTYTAAQYIHSIELANRAILPAKTSFSADTHEPLCVCHQYIQDFLCSFASFRAYVATPYRLVVLGGLGGEGAGLEDWSRVAVMNLQGPSCGAGRQEHVQRLLLECRSRIHAGDAGGAMQVCGH